MAANSNQHTHTIKCTGCGKQIRLKAEFDRVDDIVHIVELVMKMEEKGWKCKATMTGYGHTLLRLDPKCEACIVAGGNSRYRR